MAELGVLASIVGIAALGVKISKTLYQIGRTTTGAAHNINRIATNVTLFSSMLKHVGKVIQDARSLHSPECIETIENLVKECESVFQDILRIIYSAKNSKGEASLGPIGANEPRRRRMSVVSRAKWYFERPEVDHLLAQLEYLKTTLSVLIQTLNLAAVTAQANENGVPEPSAAPEVVQEKLHVETLIVAQQLSVNLLQESQEKYGQELERDPGAEVIDKEAAMEQQYPKLLTQGSQSSLHLVKLGDGDLHFLDRRPLEDTKNGAPLEQTVSRSDVFIDELLDRWTMPAPSHRRRHHHGHHHGHRRKDASADEDQLVLVSEPADVNEAEGRAVMIPASGTQTPGLQLQIVQSPEEELSQQIDIAPPKVQPLDPRLGPPRSSKAWGTTAQSTHLGPNDRTASVPGPDTLIRTKSNPETEGSNALQTLQDHHRLAEHETRPQVNLSYFPPPPPMPQSFWQTAQPHPNHAYALAPYAPHAAPKPVSRREAYRNSNYRSPYVDSDSSSDVSTCSEDGRPHSKSRTRRDSNISSHKYKDSGIGEGLGIPWRISIGRIKYFDFRDDMLVGPRTPYPPTEPITWIQNHANGRTIISKKWVSDQAIMDHHYKFKDFMDTREGGGSTIEEGFWVILEALKFHEVERLVNRTLDYYRGRNESKRGSTSTSKPRSPHPQNRSQAGSAQRGASFNEAGPPSFSPTTQGPVNAQYTTPPLPGAPFSPVTSTDPATLQGPRTNGPDWRQKAIDRAQASERERDRDRSRERWLEEKEHRHRDRARGSRRKHKHRDDRHRDEKDDKKSKSGSHGSMAGTIAKIGGLAALLEGLDGAF